MEPKFKPIIASVDDSELLRIVEEIEKARPLLEQGLMRESELTSLQTRARNAYEGTADHQSIQYRKYDKQRREHTIWRKPSRSGYVGMSDATVLFTLEQQITELLNLHSIDVQPTELFIPPGSDFTARFYIRNIFSRASVSIDIKDDYLFSANATTKNIDILWIIQPYLEAPLTISARLLGADQNPPTATASDIQAFLRQNPNAEVKGNTRSGTRKETHDRFVIVDKKEVFKIGASIKDLGAAQTGIDLVNDATVAQSYTAQFESWWTNAHNYSNI